MNALFDLAMANQMFVLSAAALILLALLVYHYRCRLGYFLQEVDYHIPWFGRTGRLMRRRNHFPDENGWFPAELKVCADYYRFYRQYNVNKKYFQECRAYLDKVGELGRRPKPWLLWALIVVMIFVEAYGFSYVLAMSPWAFAGASLRDVPLLASAIALMLAIVAVILTDLSGHELYLNAMARRVRRDFTAHSATIGVSLQPSRHQVRLGEDQNQDDGELACIQALNRLSRRPNEISHALPVIAVIVLIGIASGSTYVRYKAFERDMIQQQQIVAQEQRARNERVLVNPRLPGHLERQATAAEQKATLDAQNVDEEGAWATFLMLAFIFLALQTVAVFLGYRFGFAGKESKRAWLATHDFDGPDDYANYYMNRRSDVVNQAQVRLSDIQGRIRRWVERNPTDGVQIDAAKNQGRRTFLTYTSRIGPVLLASGE